MVQGCNSTKVRRKALKDDLSLKQVLHEARSLELSETRASTIEQAVSASASSDNCTYAITRGQTRARGFHHRRGNHDPTGYGTKQQCGLMRLTRINVAIITVEMVLDLVVLEIVDVPTMVMAKTCNVQHVCTVATEPIPKK